MNRILKIVVGLSLSASSVLYASADHTGDHMHEGKMTNHMNPDGATNTKMKQMNHSKMNMKHKKFNISNNSIKPYHHTILVDGYKIMISSVKPLKSGKNDITITILKDKKNIKNVKNVNINFSMPLMSGMEFRKNAELKGTKYNTNINFSMSGEWAYELIFKTSDGSTHKVNNSVYVK